MKGLLELLFRGHKKPGASDLREALKQVERDRRRVRTGIRRWERKRAQVVDRIKTARAANNSVEVDYLWDELKSHRQSGHELKRQGRVHNAEGIALRRYLSALEQLGTPRDPARSQALIARLQASGLMERLSVTQARDDRSLADVQDLLEGVGPVLKESVDSEKALFLGEIDAIRSISDDGRSEEAARREDELIESFHDRPEGEQ